MYFGALCHGYAVNCYFVYLVIPGTRPILMRNKNAFVFLCSSKRMKFHVCSNKHVKKVSYLQMMQPLHWMGLMNSLMF